MRLVEGDTFHQALKLLVCRLEQRRHPVGLPLPVIRNLACSFVEPVVADIRPSVLGDGAHLNLRFESNQSGRDLHTRRFVFNNLHNVMHRAIAELVRPQAREHIEAVGFVDVERLANDAPGGLDLRREMHDHAQTDEVRQLAQGVGILVLLDDLVGETDQPLGPPPNSRQRELRFDALFEDAVQEILQLFVLRQCRFELLQKRIETIGCDQRCGGLRRRRWLLRLHELLVMAGHAAELRGEVDAIKLAGGYPLELIVLIAKPHVARRPRCQHHKVNHLPVGEIGHGGLERADQPDGQAGFLAHFPGQRGVETLPRIALSAGQFPFPGVVFRRRRAPQQQTPPLRVEQQRLERQRVGLRGVFRHDLVSFVPIVGDWPARHRFANVAYR